jgi:23S rRNA pseudouridine2605 synthase
MGGKVVAKSGRGQGARKAKPEAQTKVGEPMRIAKAIAHAGLCSRRDAEVWIEQGRVTVNGKVLTTPAHVVGESDRVIVDGKPLPETGSPRLWRYHKPKGLLTSHKDPQGRKTVFEALPVELPRVVSVGRLDIGTEGLLLLTTDGELARHLELPSTGWLRRYRVRAHGRVTQEQLDALRDGVTIDGVHYGPVEARIDREQGSNVWLMLGLREGKNREVKRLAEHLGLTVNRLIRISFGPFALGDLAPGAVSEVKTRVLADQLGTKLTEMLGLRSENQLRRAARKR